MGGLLQLVWERLASSRAPRSAGPVAMATVTAPAPQPAADRPLPEETLFGSPPRRERPALSRQATALSGRWVQAAYVTIDVACICLVAVAVFLARFLPASVTSLGWSGVVAHFENFPLPEYAASLLLYVALVVLFCQSQDLYRTPRARTSLDESLAVVRAVGLATLLLTAFIFLSGSKSVSRLVVGFTGALTVVTLASWRVGKRRLVERRVAEGHGARNALIIGAGRVGKALAQQLERDRHLGYVVKGFLDANHHDDPRLLGKVEDLPRVAQTEFADVVFVTIPSERELVKSVVHTARACRMNVKVVPDLFDGLGWKAPLNYVGDFPVMELHREPIPALGLIVKRGMDIVLSAAALVALLPVYAAIAALIKLDSRGPVLYGAPRVGRKGRIFVCYKFRTMVDGADAVKAELRARNERNGPFFKMADDPRVTRVGRRLRRYSLDELPQFWNVFRGEMSLVGPRPHPVDDCQQYTLEHLRRLDVKPGITGLWQVTARQDPSFERNMALDLEYIENWSLWLDLQILLRTLPAALRGTGA